ncbi:MAG TPA: FAD-dependent thymidylate synthase [Acidimicrobiia bacterium]|nr:FAD-dependent thymidylate synthase [Acidimicrobiia bacterium]
MAYYQEPLTSEERAVLSPFFTNLDGPVFALINLPEVVKGALFARYSRSPKSLRRLFLDEFVKDPETGIDDIASRIDEDDPRVGLARAEDLYQRIFYEYGDDSVAQLGGVHLACEQASNILTKVLEWGRLAAYLEQSTRYIAYDVRLGGKYRYMIPPELEGTPLEPDCRTFTEEAFTSYASLVDTMAAFYRERFPQGDDPSFVWRASIRAKACDAVRGLLPASTLSNVGIYGTGQAYEMALMRMRAHPLSEVQAYGELMLEELRKVIPSFLTRVDRPDRGGAWSSYLASTRSALESLAPDVAPDPSPAVTLTDWDPEGEVKVAAAALYAGSELPDSQLLAIARAMSDNERRRVIEALVGQRANRRHKPGRAMERTTYRFDVTCDFGAFRDLQRHRMMTIEWQRLGTRLGYDLPDDLVEAGVDSAFDRVMDRGGELYETVRSQCGADVAQYMVPFAFNIRFVMEMNARQAFHLLELRTQQAGHPSYRAVCAEMHRQISNVAGHRALASAMSYVDYGSVDLERLEGERRAAARREAASPSGV